MSDDNNNYNNAKWNRISDDSGVVCFNTTDEFLNASQNSSSCNSFTSGSLASAMLLTSERLGEDHTRAVGASIGQFEYKSVYTRKTSYDEPQGILNCNNNGEPIKRRQKRGNYVIGSGQTEDTSDTGDGGKYGSKRLTHVQQMRLRFENWCSLKADSQRCEAENCKRTQFDSLPIIPFGKANGGSRERSDKSAAESPVSPIIEVITTDTELETELDEGKASQACECSSEGDKEEFRENGNRRPRYTYLFMDLFARQTSSGLCTEWVDGWTAKRGSDKRKI